MTPKNKIDLMRQYEVSPGAAFLNAIDLLRNEMKDILTNSIKDLSTDVLKEYLSKEGLDHAKVAEILMTNPSFVKSTKGQDGKEGAQGKKGDKPVLGVDFKAPRAGIDYPIPKNGQDGKPGDTIVGPVGPAGKDGSPDKPLDIAGKLNTLFEAVDLTVIRGLKTHLNNLELSIREKSGSKSSGGGSGNWTHQLFSLTSATTTVTLSNKVAAGGYAIMVRYQGQLLDHGQQYTISGKVITLTFTPENSTQLSVTYVRA